MNYFLISNFFDKTSPSDFGLEYIDGKYIRKDDNTEWLPCKLYDFGWGPENGFYKVPLAPFEELINVIVGDSNRDDLYGSAAMINQIYAMELKEYLLNMMSQEISDSTKKKLNEVFDLGKGTNKTASLGMSLSDIKKEYDQWLLIGDFYSKYEKKRKFCIFSKRK